MQYTVQPGDSLHSIGMTYGTTTRLSLQQLLNILSGVSGKAGKKLSNLIKSQIQQWIMAQFTNTFSRAVLTKSLSWTSSNKLDSNHFN